MEKKNSLLHRLPQEIRDEIYEYYFSEERLIWSENGTNRRMLAMPEHNQTHDPSRWRIDKWNTPSSESPDRLALLRTCLRVNQEIGDRWISWILVIFWNYIPMLDRLTALPREKLSLIRYMRVAYDSVRLHFDLVGEPDDPSCKHIRAARVRKGDQVEYNMASVLEMLPGLNLEQLIVAGFAKTNGAGQPTIYGDLHDDHAWHALKGLMTEGSGLKELCYICLNSEILDVTGPWYFGWALKLLERRDGVSSRPSVTIFQAPRASPLMTDDFLSEHPDSDEDSGSKAGKIGKVGEDGDDGEDSEDSQGSQDSQDSEYGKGPALDWDTPSVSYPEEWYDKARKHCEKAKSYTRLGIPGSKDRLLSVGTFVATLRGNLGIGYSRAPVRGPEMCAIVHPR